MKLLVITYGYPPYHAGGYELRCKDVLDRLAARGHEVLVITTRYPSNEHAIRTNEPGIFRVLHLKFQTPSIHKKIANDISDIRFIDRKGKEFQPDIIYLWHIVTLSDAIIPYFSRQDFPIVYDSADIGIVHVAKVQKRGLYFKNKTADSIIRKGLKQIAYTGIQLVSLNLLRGYWDWPQNMRVYFNGKNVMKHAQDNGVPVGDGKVIYAGLDLQIFSYQQHKGIIPPLRIITPGRIVTKKGTKDSILLVKYLVEKKIPVKLTIVGQVGSESYYKELVQIIKNDGLEDCVAFIPMVSQQELAHLYHQSDICFFPSYHRSGLSAVPLEAMACGCLVLTYGNENSTEIICEKQTGFIVPEGDYIYIANLVQGLIQNPAKFATITETARLEIEEKYTIGRYIDDIEAFLLNSIGN